MPQQVYIFVCDEMSAVEFDGDEFTVSGSGFASFEKVEESETEGEELEIVDEFEESEEEAE